MTYEDRKGSSSFLYLLAVVGALLIMNYTVSKVRENTTPAVLGAERAAERVKARQETDAAAQAAISSYGWVDKEKEIAHLPIERAMELTLREWQNPREGRAKLIAIAEKANAEPPAAPAAPSEYE